MKHRNGPPGIGRKIYGLLGKRQRISFLLILLILAVSAVLSQLTPLAVGYLTDSVLAGQSVRFFSVLPFLLAILAVNVLNEVIKVIRRLIVEDTATQVEKNARQQAAQALLMAPLSYFRGHMTGNIHGRLNRSLEGTVKLIKLVFMDFAPAVATGIAAIVMIFLQLPAAVAATIILVIPIGTAIVFRQISTQKGIRVELMETKAEMDGTMVELLGGIETIRTLDSAQAESGRIRDRSEHLRRKEMRHHKAMALYDCLKFVNEAVFSILVIASSVLLASRGVISIGTVLTAYLCFTQLTGQYQFVLSEGGRNLSGGQRQRIALARIFLRKPRILILDEATSALDNTLESSIQAELEAMMRQCGTTVLSIAHRLSTLRNCDEIIDGAWADRPARHL